ncbi:rod-binding protein [Mariprofundus ferrooxydans]|uniref:Flagellar protein FlgJ-like protein n=1 Tax=Mariprofundus ferrooxydans PV-1 TaxID=314345 RepID=Q0EYE4_9PROT|nr:rod-binding protein [Mariprofundus ferrooxydans]EAU54248.1 flagellar protein FlgJ-like protein [Mariprofundus ferrooxydans PV-1]KON47796.1 flagellar biosynthesis protein FlgJ [Mariprofundus ferrooxydans]
MRDLVETVISGIMQRERMQQSHGQTQQINRSAKPAAQVPGHAALHSVGYQVPVSDPQQKDPALWKASKQFEAIFLQQMMSEMRSTVTKSDFMPHGFAEDVHASMMDEAIAQASTQQGSIGIANAVYRQLEAGNKTQAIPNPADKTDMTTDLTMEAIRHAR